IISALFTPSCKFESPFFLAEDVDLRMAQTNRSDQPSWQQNAIFEFFSSLKLAVVLLAVLIAGAIVGTLYESSFDAKVARTYVYGAPWFNAWLVLLGANLTASAFSRWPWKKFHTAFLITHLGIITLLIGSLIGRIFGVEGTSRFLKAKRRRIDFWSISTSSASTISMESSKVIPRNFYTIRQARNVQQILANSRAARVCKLSIMPRRSREN